MILIVVIKVGVNNVDPHMGYHVNAFQDSGGLTVLLPELKTHRIVDAYLCCQTGIPFFKWLGSLFKLK
ncbi:hypothetical protein DERP_008537 [Dermatophagoides pteronyssinus]|uniref:Uncharacterized protein n=1 Tax=Dermatophagoides pteronyssinus TaxID=6956 RepID=A0ABQ8IWL4_DERPT|nr:hypothetical protein DERP_008537 [Dermatophagoides pteronyssinus]